MACRSLSAISTSSDVEYCPVFDFLALLSNLSLSNNNSPTCFGLLMLKFSPASSYIFCSKAFNSSVRLISAFLSLSTSIRTPAVSISRNTSTNGNSTSLYRFHKSASVFKADQSGSLYGLNATSGFSRYWQRRFSMVSNVGVF